MMIRKHRLQTIIVTGLKTLCCVDGLILPHQSVFTLTNNKCENDIATTLLHVCQWVIHT